MLGELIFKIGADYKEALENMRKVDEKGREMDESSKDWFSNAFDGLKDAVVFAHEGFNGLTQTAGEMAIGVGNAVMGVGDKLTTYITKPALAATAALAGLGIWQGIENIKSVETAKARFTGLGIDADKAMAQVNEAVQGTTFWTHEMAEAASMAMASGVKLGKDLTSRLDTIKAAAAGSAKPLNDIAPMINRIGASGRVMGGDLEQLQANAIPAVSMLAKELNKTEEEIRSLASEGKISAEQLFDAIDKNFGGMSELMADRTQEIMSWIPGQWAKLWQLMLGGADGDGTGNLWNAMRPMFEDIYNGLVGLEGAAISFGGKIGDAFTSFYDSVKQAVAGFKELNEATDGAAARLAATGAVIAVALGPYLKIVGAMIAAAGQFSVALAGMNLGLVGFLASMGGFGVVLGAVALSLGLLPEKFRESISELLSIADTALVEFENKFSSTFSERIPQAVADGLSLLTDTFETLTIGVDTLANVATDILRGISDGLKANDGEFMGMAVTFITSLAGAIVSVGGALIELGATLISELARGMAENPGAIEDLAMSIVESLKMAFMGIGDALGGLMDTIVEGLMGDGMGLDSFLELANEIIANIGMALAEQGPELLTAGFEILANLIQGIIEALPSILDTALNILIYLVTALEANIGTILAGGIKILVGIINGIISAIPQLAGTAMRLITFLVTSIIAMIPRLFATGVQLLLAIIEGIVSIVGNLISTATSAVNDFRAKFTSVDWASLGRSIISGIVSGVRAAASSLARAAVSAAKGALDKAKSFLGINSPSRLFEKEIGYSIPEGSALGVDKKAKLLVDSAVSMAKNAYEHGKGSVADGVRAMQKEADKLDLPNYEVQALFKSHGIDLSSLFENEKELDYQQEQKEKYNIQLWEEVVYLLGKLLDKNTDIYMNDRKVGEATAKYVQETLERSDNRGSRRMGVRTI